MTGKDVQISINGREVIPLDDACPSWADGQHCFLPTPLKADPAGYVEVSAITWRKACVCGRVVERVSK